MDRAFRRSNARAAIIKRSLKLREGFLTPALGFRIILFETWHGESFLDKLSRFFSLPHLGVGSPQLNVVHQAAWIDLESFLKATNGFLSCCLWQLSIDERSDAALEHVDIGKRSMPATKHVPGEIVLRVELYGLLGVTFYLGGGLDLRLRVHEGQHLPVANCNGELRLSVFWGKRSGLLRIVQGDAAKAELLLACLGVR